MPNGQQRLIDRGVYACSNNQSGQITFQLHGNGYRFAQGHTGRAPASGTRRALLPGQQLDLLGPGLEPLGQRCRSWPSSGLPPARRHATLLVDWSVNRSAIVPCRRLERPNGGIPDGEQRQVPGSRGSHRRGGAHADRPRSRGEGLLQGRPRLQPARQDLSGADRAHRHRCLRGRGRGRRLRAAVRRAGDQHRPQRLARGRACRSRPRRRRSTASAAPPSRPSTSAPRWSPPASTTSSSAAASSTWATSPSPTAWQVMQEHGVAFSPAAAGALQPRPAGDLGRDDRRQVGDPPLRARRDRPALPPARRQGDRGGPLRARDHPVPGQRRHLRHRPGHPPRHQPREALGS